MALWPLLWNVVQSPSAVPPALTPQPVPDAEQTRQETLQAPDWSLPVLYLRGSHYEMGWQHGHQLKEPIRTLTQQFFSQFARGPAKLFYRHLVPGRLYHLWQAVPEPYRQELQGVADGAQLPLKDILLINFFDDVLNLLELGWAFACSTLVARGRGDRVLMGRNLDYNGPVGDLVRHFQAILVRQPDSGASTVSVAVAGQVGVLTGMNQAGLSLGSMTSQTHEQNWDGLGVSVLYRLLLDRCSTVSEALSAFDRHSPAQGNNLMLADASDGVRLEFTSRRRALSSLEDKPLGISNHYLDPQLAQTHTNLYRRVTASGSQSRYDRLRHWSVAMADRIEVDGLMQAMTDAQIAPDYPLGDCDPWWTSAAVNNWGTLHSAILDPHQRQLHIAIGLGKTPIQARDFVQYRPFEATSVSSVPESAAIASPPACN
ncbi:C45 family peptidase [Synechococcus sp. PCC 7336]|uniref:C45 family autoproteolytic acyltransferase/hydolase n=1 Tax=Synechococcus sp. PCC 7336 TaxID=195250 RepID=UPI00034AA056|nr:C45 family peptidase [Synechococcus sp. PCC 7336]